MELVGNLVDRLWQRGSGWLAPRAAPRAVARRRVDALCDRIDADVWRQVFSLTRTVNGTGHTGPSEFCATSI